MQVVEGDGGVEESDLTKQTCDLAGAIQPLTTLTISSTVLSIGQKNCVRFIGFEGKLGVTKQFGSRCH